MAAFAKLLRVRVVGAGIATLLAIGGCVDRGTDQVPITSGPASHARISTSEPALREPTADDLSRIARYKVPPSRSDYWIKQWVGPAGGTVEYMGFRIVVPPGAVDRIVMFSIRVPGKQDPAQEYVLAEFGPHNYTFRVPVRIELPYANTTVFGSSSGVLWYDERAATWVAMPGSGITADGQRVYVDTNHFSTYGTEGGGVTPAGG